MSIITLTSDFGLRDGFVGIMKGVICTINPHATYIDISHEIARGDIEAAAWVIGNAYSYFPDGTVHVIVVDPGVGSKRRGLAISSLPSLAEHSAHAPERRHMFVCPDNGIMTRLLAEHPSWSNVVEIQNLDLCLSPISNTFHGRDMFAPVAAHLSAGVKLTSVGPAVDLESLVRFRRPGCATIDDQIFGAVVYIDYFGNLITNIPVDDNFRNRATGCVINRMDLPVVSTYSSLPEGCFLAFGGSHGYVEIAVNGGRADRIYGVAVGTEVVIDLGR